MDGGDLELCSICGEPKKHSIQYLPECGHTFHINCIQGWFKRDPDNTCPLCRTHHMDEPDIKIDMEEQLAKLRKEKKEAMRAKRRLENKMRNIQMEAQNARPPKNQIQYKEQVRRHNRACDELKAKLKALPPWNPYNSESNLDPNPDLVMSAYNHLCKVKNSKWAQPVYYLYNLGSIAFILMVLNTSSYDAKNTPCNDDPQDMKECHNIYVFVIITLLFEILELVAMMLGSCRVENTIFYMNYRSFKAVLILVPMGLSSLILAGGASPAGACDGSVDDCRRILWSVNPLYGICTIIPVIDVVFHITMLLTVYCYEVGMDEETKKRANDVLKLKNYKAHELF